MFAAPRLRRRRVWISDGSLFGIGMLIDQPSTKVLRANEKGTNTIIRLNKWATVAAVSDVHRTVALAYASFAQFTTSRVFVWKDHPIVSAISENAE